MTTSFPPAAPGPSTLLAALALLVPTDAGAQAPHPLPPLLPDSVEVPLALSAAPPEISAGAAVWALRPHGYERVTEGTTGWTCLVERDHPESLAPLCYDPEGTRTILPAVLRLEALRMGGMTWRQAADSVEALFASGGLERPARPVLAYMLSKEQRLHATPEGPPVGAWKPHIMVYWPGLSAEALALPEDPGAPVGAGGTGGLFSYLVIPVARWSDGTEVGR